MKRRLVLKSLGTLSILTLAGPRTALARLVDKPAEKLRNGEFNWYPERSPTGPIIVIVSLPEQKVFVYRNGVQIAASTCSTGKAGHETPTGVFKILEKDRDHKSSTYDDAPMPNMNRLTWSGIALHAGNLPGYPASHGCVRLPLEFSALLFGITRIGMTVIIADEHSDPVEVVHPGMVLGDYQRREYAAVDAALLEREYSLQRRKQKETSILVSGADGTIIVWENGRVVAQGKADIADPSHPLGNHVYILAKSDRGQGALTWTSVDFKSKALAGASLETLRRIRGQSAIMAEVTKRMHLGMTLITTNQPALSYQQSLQGFVVMDGLF